MIKIIKQKIKTLREKLRYRIDNGKLVRARRLIMEVYAKQLPGTILSYDNKDVVVMDIQFSIRKNEIKSIEQNLKHAMTRKQRAVVYNKLKEVKRTNERI